MYTFPTTLCIFSILVVVNGKNKSESRRNDDSDAGNNVEKDFASQIDDSDVGEKQGLSYVQKDENNCWMSLDAGQHFQAMGELDEHYGKIRSEYHKEVAEELDKNMLQTMLNIRGMAEREIHKAKGNINLIPAGLNLGGYCMMRMKASVLFFHRVKLRNNTRFRVNFLQTDLQDMSLTVRLSLHDLHLVGAYERAPTDKDPSILFYTPSFGEVEFLLKNVDYKMEGRLRLIKDRLIIEMVISELLIEDILMTYLSKILPEKPVRLRKENLEEFLEKLKTDLDKWLKDYFNDYLMYSATLSSPNQNFIQAEKHRTMILNEYADRAVNTIKNRIRKIHANMVKIPNFTIYGATRMIIRLKDGYVKGLRNLYRRSVATGRNEGKVRKVDLIVGFSNLKVVYKYEAVLPTNTPPLSGFLILSANELTAHMGLSLVRDPEAVDMDFDFIQQMKPESLTVEGPANRMIANFKHLLEHHIIAIMSNTLIHTIKTLRSLPKCVPILLQYVELKERPPQDIPDSDPNEAVQTHSDDDVVTGHNTQLHGDDNETQDEIDKPNSHVPTIHQLDSITMPNHGDSIGIPTEKTLDTEINDDKNIRRQHPKTSMKNNNKMKNNIVNIVKKTTIKTKKT